MKTSTETLGLRRRLALELARLQTQSLRRRHPLRQLFWESTVRCNLRCRHCGSDCRLSAATPDMPREDFMRVLDSIAQRTDPGRIFIILGGGEPLVREDIAECAQGISQRGFPWGMVTNGLLLSPQLLTTLRRAGLCSVTVSLDGMEEQHNWLRRHPDSFRAACRAIDLIVSDAGLTYDVMTCVHRRNIDQLPELRQLLVRKGVRNWRLATIFPVGRGALDPDLQLNGAQLHQLLRFIRQVRREGDIHASYGCEGFLGPYEGDVRDWMFRCSAGLTVASVLVDGSISACTSIRHNYRQGNIYRDNLMDVWEQRFQPFRNHQWMKQGPCSSCTLWRYCEGGGIHLRDDDGHLLLCHANRMNEETDTTPQTRTP